jgi:CTP:molybdopterin cytidylyltransferase MocA
MTIAGVLLAAGSGSRFDGTEHKLLADLRGRTVIAWSLDAVLAAGFNEVIVVTGAVDLSDVLPSHVSVVHAPRWAEGQAFTIQAGIAAADAAGHDAVVVGLADQPFVPASAWRSVGASRGAIVTATFDEQRRPPVKLERAVWTLLPTEGDAGARELMRLRPDLVSEVPCSGTAADIDTAEDLARWNSPTTF